MNHYPLPTVTVAPDYDHVLLLTVYLGLAGDSDREPITGIDWHILGFDTADRGPGFGTPARPGKPATALITALMSAPHVHAPAARPPTPADALLNFRTLNRTLVVIRLFGGKLWRFDATALSTKLAQGGPGYKNLVGYQLKQGKAVAQASPAGCEAIAFEVDAAMIGTTIGLNFHVDFLDTGIGRTLPVIIDPDGTNGGNRPPGQP